MGCNDKRTNLSARKIREMKKKEERNERSNRNETTTPWIEQNKKTH